MISNSFNKQYLTLFLVCLTLNESVCSFKTITKKCLGDVCTHELAVKNGKSSLLFLFRFYFTYSPPQVILNIIFIKVLSLNNFFCYLIIKKMSYARPRQIFLSTHMQVTSTLKQFFFLLWLLSYYSLSSTSLFQKFKL